MLKRRIKLFGIFSIAAGAMISSGIFILPGLAFDIAGPAVFISYFLAGILALAGILSVIELATAMPKAGGDFFYINKTFGPLLGTLTGFMGWTALSLKSAFAIYGLSEIINTYTGTSHILSGLLLCLAFVALNIKGVREAAVFQVSLVGGLFLLMFLFIGFGLPEVDPGRYVPLMRNGPGRLLFATGFVFISFGGLIKVANVAEEVVNPGRNLPLGIISSLLAVTLLYTLVTFILTGVLDAEQFRGSLTPVADGAEVFLGAPGYVLITIAASLAFISTANAGIMAAARYPLALSREHLIPPGISAIHKKSRTPVYSILITGALIIVSLMLPLETLVKAASAVVLAAFVLTNAAVIVMRESKLINYRPSFKTPLYPIFQIASIGLFLYFIARLGIETIEVVSALLLVGLLIYFFYGRKKQKREYALLTLLERVTHARLSTNKLEDDLREYLADRKNIEWGYTDKLIGDARVIDLEGSPGMEEVLKQAGRQASELSGLDEGLLYSEFKKRVDHSDICVSDFSAIVHILPGSISKMFLVMVRSRQGIKVSDTHPDVRAIFLLGGPKDDKVEHLRALIHLARLSREKRFEEQWQKGEGPIELKNALILGKARLH